MKRCPTLHLPVSRHDVALRRPEAGQTLTEYGLLLALLAMAVVGILSVVGADLTQLLATAGEEITNATTP